MATSETPDIRGVLRAELIRDLALGAETHEQLAEKYGRVTQAISNFSARNKDEIRRAKQAQSDEYQSLGYAEKNERIALRERLIADLVERLESPEFVGCAAESVLSYGRQDPQECRGGTR